MESKLERFLPIGSVVMIKGTNKQVMITGYLVSTASTGQKIYDYIACLYPEGVVSSDKNIVFNHEDIYQIYAIGYSDVGQKEFSKKLNDHAQILNSNNMDVAKIFENNDLSGKIFNIATNKN